MASEAECKKTVPLPCDLPRWKDIQNALNQLGDAGTIEELKSNLLTLHHVAHSEPESQSGDNNGNYFNAGDDDDFPFNGLLHFLSHLATEKDKSTFFWRVLPTMATLAAEIGTLKPAGGLRYSTQQEDSTTCISRRFAASVVASAFLCLFPKRSSQNLCQINFDEFFQFLASFPCQRSQGAKLRCILHYFERLSELNQDQGPPGNIFFTRQVLSREDSLNLNNWGNSCASLCPLVVRQDGRIEDTGCETLQVDFANRYIGGGVLTAGRVQEEIRFCTCPEMMVSMLFMERMEDNEAIVIRGYEQFSEYAGYANKLQFAGDFRDTCKVNKYGNLESSTVAIDAVPAHGLEDQYLKHRLSRELNKAYLGFRQHWKKTGQAGDAPFTALDSYSTSLSKNITNIAVQHAKTKPKNQDKHEVKNAAAKKLADSVVPEIMTNALEKVPTPSDDRTGVRVLPSLTEHTSNGVDVPEADARVNLDTMATHWAHGILEDVIGIDRLGNSGKLNCKVCKCHGGSNLQKTPPKSERIPTTTSEDSLHRYESSSTQRSTESRSSRDSLEDYSVISSLSCKSDSFVKMEFESDMDSTSGSQSSNKSSFSVNGLVRQILDDAYIKLYGAVPLRRSQGERVSHGRQKSQKDSFIQVNVPGCPTDGEQPWTPPPSPSSPETESSPRMDDSASRLEMCSERLRASISSADSSNTGADSAPLSVQDIQIRECAQEVVARTLSESIRVLGGSLTTSSSSTSSRRSSSRTSSIPCSSGSKRSSIDTFTEDLLKIANIDPHGKRPSRTEESLAYFAEEMQRRIEDDDRHQERRKSELEDFEKELSKSSVSAGGTSSESEPPKYTRSIDLYADRHATDVICDAFVQIYGRPWSGAFSSDQTTSESEALPSDVESVPGIHIEESARTNAANEMSEADLISMATNLSNVIIKSALRVYQEQLRQQHSPWQPSSVQLSGSPPMVDRGTSLNQSHDQYAGGAASNVVKDSLGMVCEGEQGDNQHGCCRVKPIATGNWGCGAFGGDPQLKSLIQWLAASQAGCPAVYYYTFGDKRVKQLEEVVEIVKIRDWKVGDLAQAILKYSQALTDHSSYNAESIFGHILHLL